MSNKKDTSSSYGGRMMLQSSSPSSLGDRQILLGPAGLSRQERHPAPAHELGSAGASAVSLEATRAEPVARPPRRTATGDSAVRRPNLLPYLGRGLRLIFRRFAGGGRVCPNLIVGDELVVNGTVGIQADRGKRRGEAEVAAFPPASRNRAIAPV